METIPKPTSIWQGTTPQLAFIFGLIAGVAATAVVTIFLVLPNAGKTKTAATTTTTNTSGTTQPTYGDVKAVSDEDNLRGDANAKLTLIEYSDYECPFCKTFHPTMQRVLEDYDGQVAWVYRHFPLSFHANAPKEAEAALCVSDLGGNDKFWEFSDALFARTASNGTGFALDQLAPLAKEIGVDEAKFTDCLNSGRMAARITANMTDGQGAGASGTPTTFIVGPDGKTITAIPGALPYESIKTQLDQILAGL
jgi:protein-disulfide isomerase